MRMRRISTWIFLVVFFGSLFFPIDVGAQTATPPPEVARLLDTLSPEERVGQLFLVSFDGVDASAESHIYDLINNYHVGGVVLMAKNDNFTEAPDTLQDAYQLINTLQQLEWDSAGTIQKDPDSGETFERAYVPLFVGIEQDGGGYPSDQILNGLTGIPNAMAIGATWKPELAQQIGEIQGQELASLGFNLYLGPSLDVLETPNPNARGNIGTRSFGGDPYWVGVMGSAFIKGLHLGSEGKMLVVAKRFPGLGGSDRPANEEVATVRKSLEQLKQIELAPFFSVTGNAPDALSTVDGLLVSHIRFQGFQGNIRATTRPISFDQQALGEILALQELARWRSEGGLIISDNLDSHAVYTFYAPANQGFSAQLVARDAFLAGNDVLFLGNITSGEPAESFATTVIVLQFFTQRYREDPAFAQLVDEAVARILTRKRQLFGRFAISNVLAPQQGLAELGRSQQPLFEVARRSATLISPDPQELASILPSPPALRDRMVFITGTEKSLQCSTCTVRSMLAVNAFQEAVLHLYGPTGGGQVSEARLNSYSFDDLSALLNGTDVATMESDINRAGWIILALVDANAGQPELVSRFLSERQDLLREKRVILFSFTAPYYLDATDISKLTAYYGLYSKQPAFVDVAARLLYQELTPLGNSPVSIPGTGYDLIEATRPNPDQVITLFLDTSPVAEPTSLPTTPEPTPIPLLGIGDTVYVRTGTILDHNGHVVPDGTVVRFSLLLSSEAGGIIQQIDQTTKNGVAQASFGLEKPGLLEIRATSEPATLSDVIQIDVTSGEVAAITVIAPIPSETIEPVLVTPTPLQENGFISVKGTPRLGGWVMAMLFVALSSWLAYWAGTSLYSERWGRRWGLCAFLGGLAGYNYLALGFPGSAQVLLISGMLGLLGIPVLGELIGLGAAWLWSRRS
jgi:beta-N-acetylhexosaminidase